ncbi:MAG TPA: SRPBCC domain-containing protein [Cyclobacteriaceae bacterium]|nr:SRPBCC domain-containing protein [Cyclobacteriaceae bacterium]
MLHLEYKIEISAPAKTVWHTMLGEETYKQWAGKSWPDSFYEGKWAKGEEIRFIGPDGSGTLAKVVALTPYKSIVVQHIAMLDKGREDRTSDGAKGWIGTMEGYKFDERDGNTTVTVTMETTPEWQKMFDDGWPGALDELKKISERQMASV